MPRLERESVCVLYLTPERPIAASPALAALAMTNPTPKKNKGQSHYSKSSMAIGWVLGRSLSPKKDLSVSRPFLVKTEWFSARPRCRSSLAASAVQQR